MAGAWHPLHDAAEPSPGVWVLRDAFGREHSRIELRRTSAGPRFRVEFRGELLGWASTLREACARAQGSFIRGHGPGLRTAAPESR